MQTTIPGAPASRDRLSGKFSHYQWFMWLKSAGRASEDPPRPILRTPFWQARFYDFNVWTTKKRLEKRRYMHRNPVKRGLVSSPQKWRWSSDRSYLLDVVGRVLS